MTDTDEFSSSDLRRRLDAAMGAGPALPTTNDRVRQGRRALRRRRLAQGVASVAAIAVVGSGATYAVTTVTGDDTASDVAAGPTGDLCPVLPPMSAENAAALPDVEPTRRLSTFPLDPVYYEYTDESFTYKPGLRGLEHLTGTLTRDGHPDTRWNAVELEGSNGRFYGLTTFTPSADGNGGGGSDVYRRVEPGHPSLSAWVTLQLPVRSGSPQDAIEVDDDGGIETAPGVEILGRQTADPIRGYDSVGQVAAVRRGPDTCFAFIDESTVYLVPPEYITGATLDDFAAAVARIRGMGR